jgi:hypothetical protein
MERIHNVGDQSSPIVTATNPQPATLPISAVDGGRPERSDASLLVGTVVLGPHGAFRYGQNAADKLTRHSRRLQTLRLAGGFRQLVGRNRMGSRHRPMTFGDKLHSISHVGHQTAQ